MVNESDWIAAAVKAKWNPYFAEAYIISVLGGEATSKTCAFDCILGEHKIEIKSSSPILNRPKKNADGEYPIYFFWSHLLGADGKSKIGKVDYYILVGYYEKIHVWIVPGKDVKKDKAEYQIYPKKNKSWGWVSKYYVGDENDMISYFEKRGVK